MQNLKLACLTSLMVVFAAGCGDSGDSSFGTGGTAGASSGGSGGSGGNGQGGSSAGGKGSGGSNTGGKGSGGSSAGGSGTGGSNAGGEGGSGTAGEGGSGEIAGSPPTATINHPGNGEMRDVNDPIPFIGVGTDPEDGDLTGAALVWTSDVEGEIGTGEMFDAALTQAGMQVITLTVTDSDGNEATDSITLDIQ